METGGLAFDSGVLRDGRDFFPNGHQRLTLTSKGVMELVKVAPHLLPDLSLSFIKDKSKANQLAKTIVIFQASWFVAQCISRMALGMTVSLVELNTFAHAICALIACRYLIIVLAYLLLSWTELTSADWLWWEKPLDIEEPTIITGENADLVCVGLCMRTKAGARFWYSNYGSGQKSTHLYYDSRLDPDPASAASLSDLRAGAALRTEKRTMPNVLWVTKRPETSENPSYFPVDPPTSDPVSSSAPSAPSSQQPFRLYLGQCLFGFLARYPPTQQERLPSIDLPSIKKHGFLHLHRPYLTLSPADVLRLRLARECYAVYPSLREELPRKSGNHELWYDDLLCSRIKDLPAFTNTAIGDPSRVSMFGSLFFAGLAYGGLHLLPWSPPVRTATETLLWRISGIAIITYGAVPLVAKVGYMGGYYVWKWVKWVVRSVVPEWLRRIEWKLERWHFLMYGNSQVAGRWPVRGFFFALLRLVCVWILWLGLGVVELSVLGATLLYLFSRVYLVVECFISVGRLPESAFDTPSWSQYMPHLS